MKQTVEYDIMSYRREQNMIKCHIEGRGFLANKFEVFAVAKEKDTVERTTGNGNRASTPFQIRERQENSSYGDVAFVG